MSSHLLQTQTAVSTSPSPSENNHESRESKLAFETSSKLEALGGQRPLPVNRLTPREMDSLTAISDTFLPSIELAPGAGNESLRTFYLTSASMLGTPGILGDYISERLQHALLGLLRLGLWLLSTWYGTFILCGTKSLSNRFPYFQKLSHVEPCHREEILRSWSMSSILLLRKFYSGLKFLVVLVYFTQVNEKNENPTWETLGYCGPDPEMANQLKRAETTNTGTQPNDDNEQRFGPLHKALVNMTAPRDQVSSALARVGLAFTTQPTPGRGKPIPTIQCDAVVVGSGSGGGVVAGVLAAAGYKVVVLEKGGYYARGSLSLLEGAALNRMYEGGGFLASDDMGIVILSGSNVGGGSSINWSASLRTPAHVMREWRDLHGLDLFGSDAYEQALDAVCSRMGVQSGIGVENLSNAVLRRGCNELGYAVQDVPRNAPPDHYCGWCCFGCRDGRKQGTAETWLLDLAESRNGVILPGCTALRVLHEDKGRERNVATGVVFEFEDVWSGQKKTCMVQSRVTVVACGALRTPVLLRRSGLSNPHIGKHLHLHPVVMVWGYFPESDARWEGEEYGPKKSYEGGIITAMSTVLSNASTTGYGAVIQTPSLHPGMFSVVMPWTSGANFKDRMTRFARTAHIFSLARDRGSGAVDATGSISYKVDGRDEETLKRGVEKMLRIMAAAGAAEVGTHHCEGERLDLRQASSREFEEFVRAAAKRELRDLSTPVCSAHQMGSCRMGTNTARSAVDARGETWEVEGLFVADTSVFPTALGVNPMVTVQAISYCTAQSVLEVLKRKMKKSSSKLTKTGNVHF